jgi:hypothetical protein
LNVFTKSLLHQLKHSFQTEEKRIFGASDENHFHEVLLAANSEGNNLNIKNKNTAPLINELNACKESFSITYMVWKKSGGIQRKNMGRFKQILINVTYANLMNSAKAIMYSHPPK